MPFPGAVVAEELDELEEELLGEDGPSDTSIVMVAPLRAVLPPAGLWLITSPFGTVLEYCSDTDVVNPELASALSA